MKIDKEYLASLVGKTIRFTKAIEEWGMYAENGMQAIVQKWYFDEAHEFPVHKIWVDFAPFEKENHKRQNSNWYDKDGKATLTAVEAGWYLPVDSIYIDDDTNALPFEIID